MVFRIEVKFQQIPSTGSNDFRVEDDASLTNAYADVLGQREWESDKGKEKCELHRC